MVDADVVGQGIVNRPDMVETAYDCISPHSGERKPFLGGDLIADRRSAEEVEGDEMSSGTYEGNLCTLAILSRAKVKKIG